MAALHFCKEKRALEEYYISRWCKFESFFYLDKPMEKPLIATKAYQNQYLILKTLTLNNTLKTLKIRSYCTIKYYYIHNCSSYAVIVAVSVMTTHYNLSDQAHILCQNYQPNVVP